MVGSKEFWKKLVALTIEILIGMWQAFISKNLTMTEAENDRRAKSDWYLE